MRSRCTSERGVGAAFGPCDIPSMPGLPTKVAAPAHTRIGRLTRPGIGSSGFKRSSAGSAHDPLRPTVQAIQPSPCHAGLAEPPILQRLRTFSAFRTGYVSPSPFGSRLVRRPMEHSSEFPPICDRDSTSRWTAQVIIGLTESLPRGYCGRRCCSPVRSARLGLKDGTLRATRGRLGGRGARGRRAGRRWRARAPRPRA